MIERLLTILVSVPIITYCTYVGEMPFYLLVALLTLISLNEFYNMLKSKGFSPYYTVGNIFTFIIVSFVQYTLKHPNWEPVSSALLTMAVIATFCAAIFIRRSAMATANIAITLLGMLYVGWLFSYLVLLRALTPHGAFLFLLILVIWTNDTSAYIIGRKFGKRQLSPYISPKKTVEGAAAGFFMAVLASFAFGVIYERYTLGLATIVGMNGRSSLLSPNWRHYLIIGAIIGICAQLSDLAESLIKRDAGVKDSSNIVPGHGGVLDRMDSFIFTAPVLYYYISWFLMR